MREPAAQRFENWLSENPVRPEMLWKGSAQAQFEKFQAFAERMTPGEPLTVISTHTSKSIPLPVVSLRLNHGFIVLRDNFYDINMSFLWDFAPDLDLEDVYPSQDWDWYLEKISRCEGYTWRGWSEEEIADPRILRVQVRPSRGEGNLYWKEVKGDVKDRWVQRFESTAWFTRDWASGTKLLVKGEMGPGCKFFYAENAFAQGMENLPYGACDIWEPGVDKGIFALPNLEAAERVARALMSAEPLCD